jgi:hypothetical protein
MQLLWNVLCFQLLLLTLGFLVVVMGYVPFLFLTLGFLVVVAGCFLFIFLTLGFLVCRQ